MIGQVHAPAAGEIEPVRWCDAQAAAYLYGGHEGKWADWQQDLRELTGDHKMEENDNGNAAGWAFARTMYDEKGLEVFPPQKLEVQLVGRTPAIYNGAGHTLATEYEVKCTPRDEAPVAEIKYVYWFRDRETQEKLYYAGNDSRNRIIVRDGGCFWVQARRENKDGATTRFGPEVRVTPDSLGTPTHRNY